jgi:hypothetical protein
MSKKYIIFTYILNKTYIYQVHFLKIIDKKKKKNYSTISTVAKQESQSPFLQLV